MSPTLSLSFMLHNTTRVKRISICPTWTLIHFLDQVKQKARHAFGLQQDVDQIQICNQEHDVLPRQNATLLSVYGRNLRDMSFFVKPMTRMMVNEAVPYSLSYESNDSCPICYEIYTSPPLQMFRCSHAFCLRCCATMVYRQAIPCCPLCRA